MCRSAKNKASRRASSIRSTRGFTNPTAPYIIAEENGYVMSKPPPAPQQGLPYTALMHVNGQANRPLVPTGTRPAVALKPPASKKPVVPRRPVSVERGTVVRSAPPPPRPYNPPKPKPIVPEKTFLYHDGRQGNATINHEYMQVY